jgi:YD repeat-containing protein
VRKDQEAMRHQLQAVEATQRAAAPRAHLEQRLKLALREVQQARDAAADKDRAHAAKEAELAATHATLAIMATRYGPQPGGQGVDYGEKVRLVRRDRPQRNLDFIEVDVASGAESFYRPLISVAGARELEFGLHYNSAFAGVASPVGRGWSHPFAARITQNGDEVTVIWSPTRQNTFRLVRASTGAYYRCPDQDVRNDVLAKLSDGGFSYTKLDQTVHTFNSNGSLTQLANARGQRITISASGTSLSTLTEAATNARLTFTHTSGLMTRITDTLGRQVNLAYDANGFLTSITDPNGSTTTYAYNAGGRLERVTAPGGVEIYRNTYDTLGRVVSQNDARADNKLLTFKYDEKTRPGHVITTVTDRNGAVTIYTHDHWSR